MVVGPKFKFFSFPSWSHKVLRVFFFLRLETSVLVALHPRRMVSFPFLQRLQSFFGAIGILLISIVGGRLFDGYGGYAPFYAIAIANGIVFISGLMLRGYELKSHHKLEMN